MSVIDRYQQEFARAVEVPFAFAFWKGRVALHAILQALQIKHGDEVILPGFTCVVVPNAIRMVGARPVYADILQGTYNLDPDSVARAITPRTRALLVQHTFGIPADMSSLLALAERHRLAIIEDCAHAFRSSYGGRPVGTFGLASFYSSQWSKPFTTGLGGMAVTTDPDLAARLKKVQGSFVRPSTVHTVQLRIQYLLYQRLFTPKLYWRAMDTLHFLSQRGLFVGSSSNEELDGTTPHDSMWTMSAFQANSGLSQLSRIGDNVLHRQRLRALYDSYLEAQGWPAAIIPGPADAILLRYPLRVGNKWELLQRTQKARVELGSWFESVLHPVRRSLERFGYQWGQCPTAEQTANEVVNLPLHPRVSLPEAERIVEFVCRAALRPSASMHAR